MNIPSPKLAALPAAAIAGLLTVGGCADATAQADPSAATSTQDEHNPEPMVLLDGTTTMQTIDKSDEQWKQQLDAETYYVTRQAGTERPFTGKYWNHKAQGIYVDKLSGVPLFSSDTKFDSGTGWPSFYDVIEDDNIILREDRSHGMVRTEVVSRASGAHLGHLFNDGPAPTGLRYCINSAALDFVPGATTLPDPKMPSLQTQLDTRREAWAEQADDKVKSIYEEGVQALRDQGVADNAVQQGDAAPGFTLPSATGEQVQLSELLEQGPVVLTWYRGGWCPYCNIQLRAYQQQLDQFKQYDATLVAISPELPDHSLSTKQKNELEFVVLSDPGNEVAAKYGLAYTLPQAVQDTFKGKFDLAVFNGDDSGQLPLAATYVINRDGQVVYAFVDADYRQRAEPAAILDALKATAQ